MVKKGVKLRFLAILDGNLGEIAANQGFQNEWFSIAFFPR